MRITANIDILRLVDQTTRAQKNLLYSTVQGINDTAKRIQVAQQKALSDDFTLRTPTSRQFLQRQVAIIRPFASVKGGRIYAEVAVGTKAKLMLSDYEAGGDRAPSPGRRAIAVPVTGHAVRPRFSDPINQQFKFSQLKMKAMKGPNANGVSRGRFGTYSVPASAGNVNRLVFRRFGKGPRDTELIYLFVSKKKLPAKLGWEQRARSVANQWLNESITQAFLRSSTRTP